MVQILVRRLDADMPMPSYACVGDAGVDLASRVDIRLPPRGGRSLVPTGIAVAIPVGYAGFLQPRSGLALRHGVTLLNSPGLIDSGYRDELAVLMINTDPTSPYLVKRGDRIAQMVVQAIEDVQLVAVSVLPDSERAMGGFGHSGR